VGPLKAGRFLIDTYSSPPEEVRLTTSRLSCAPALSALSILAGLMLLAAPASRAGSLYEAEGFSLEIPDGWVQIPQADVERAAQRMAAEGVPANLRVLAAFGPKDARAFAYPYVMVQLVGYPASRPPTESEMREMVRQINAASLNESMKGASKQIRIIAKTASVSEPDFDPEAKKYMIPLEMRVPGVGTIRGKTAGHFGKRHLVQVCCYDRADTFGTSELKFNSILDSFKWAEHSKIPAPKFGDKGMNNALGGGAAVVLLAMFVSGFRKARADRASLPPAIPTNLAPATRDEAPWRSM
jgi:hypothetical protein